MINSSATRPIFCGTNDVDQGFDLTPGGNIVGRFFEGFDGVDAGRFEFFDRRRGNSVLQVFSGGNRFWIVKRRLQRAGGFFEIGGVAAARIEDDFAFANFGWRHEFMGVLASHDAGVRFYWKSVESAAAEDLNVGVIHFLVAGLRRLIGDIKAVGVFHNKFPRSHQAKSRADFVAEFRLDLVEVDWELAVRMDFTGDERGDDFFVGGAEYPFSLGAVLRFEEDAASGFVAAALLPDFRRLQGGHQYFEGAGAVHFFPHNGLDFLQNSKPQREKCIQTAGQFSDEPRSEKKAMRKDFRFGRGFPQSWNECLTPAHG